jgi:Fe-S cluster assembly protein SufB
VFTDGSFVYIPPKGVRCPMELSTYFRINEKNTGQFERTLIIADKGAYVSLSRRLHRAERDENQLHAAVVELIALDDAEIKYSTVQNWYPGDKEGKGGIYNFVTKRGDCRGAQFQDFVDAGRDRLGDHLEISHPASCAATILRGEFYSIAITNGRQQVDSGTKMIHLGKNTRSRIISKGIAGRSPRTPIAASCRRMRKADGRAQLHPVRQLADRRQLRRPHRALYRGRRTPARISSTRRRRRKSPTRPAVLLHAARPSEEEASR